MRQEEELAAFDCALTEQIVQHHSATKARRVRAMRCLGLRPNVQAKRETTVARQARAVENAPAPLTGPGGLPLALRLSEGLGVTFAAQA